MREIRKVAILGAGAMGTGIAQVCAQAGYPTLLIDADPRALSRSRNSLDDVVAMLKNKGKLSTDDAEALLGRLDWSTGISAVSDADLVIEAIVEDLQIKSDLLKKIEPLVAEDAIIASNTSSLSITALAAVCQRPDRFFGLHFFNPAPLMKLVELIPALQSEPALTDPLRAWVESLGKQVVVAADTPGFIVNRLARSYYSEAIRIVEEQLASPAQLDAVMRELGGFRMGPFELMDLIGHDVNFAVTQSVFNSFYYDQRYKPSITQQKLVEAGRLGRKTGQGFYTYPRSEADVATYEAGTGKELFERIIAMLINEAADAVYLGVCTAAEADTAMQLGANYPRGLIAWGRELGLDNIKKIILNLRELYAEDRYRPSRGLDKLQVQD